MQELEPDIPQLLSIQKRYVTQLMDMDQAKIYSSYPIFHRPHKEGFCTFPETSSMDAQLPESQACSQGWSVYQMQRAFLEKEWPTTFRMKTADNWTKELLVGPKPDFSKPFLTWYKTRTAEQDKHWTPYKHNATQRKRILQGILVHHKVIRDKRDFSISRALELMKELTYAQIIHDYHLSMISHMGQPIHKLKKGDTPLMIVPSPMTTPAKLKEFQAKAMPAWMSSTPEILQPELLPAFFEYMLTGGAEGIPKPNEDFWKEMNKPRSQGNWQRIRHYQVVMMSEGIAHGYPDPRKYRGREPTK